MRKSPKKQHQDIHYTEVEEEEEEEGDSLTNEVYGSINIHILISLPSIHRRTQEIP